MTDVAGFFLSFQVLCWEEEESELERLKSRLSQLYYENLIKVCFSLLHAWPSMNSLWASYKVFLLVQLDAPVEGLKEWLDAVHTAGIPCAIVSCLDRRYMHESLQKMGLKKYFQVDFMRNSTCPLLFMIVFDAAIKLMVPSRGL